MGICDFEIGCGERQLADCAEEVVAFGKSCALLAFARGRKYAFAAGRLSLWTIVGFALGPLGFLLMLSLIEWPAMEKCTSCGRQRLVTHECCDHCASPFTPPQSDGTEIFEPI